MNATTPMPEYIHGVSAEELKQGAINTLKWAALELQGDTPNYRIAMQHADAAVACLWSLANASKGDSQ